MSNELRVADCPNCGKIFQMNLRNLCASCSTEIDNSMRLIEKALMVNRKLNIDEKPTAATNVPQDKIRLWIRSGKIKLYDYPNLTDACDRCGGPIRRGSLCLSCSTKIQKEIEHEPSKSAC